MTNPIKQEAIRIRRESAKSSISNFAETYLEHHVKDYKPSAAHEEIYKILHLMSETRSLKFAMAAPRGFGKSTLISLIYLLYCICYKTEKYIVLISETADSVSQILENVKKELTENEKIMTDFPDAFESGEKPKPPRWNQFEIQTRNDIKIAALGVNQPIRGRKFGKDRPTLVVLDDVESARNTASPEMREKLKSWFRKAVLHVGSEKTNYVFLGNLHHVDCLLGEYLNPNQNNTWIKKVYRAVIAEPKYLELWEEWAKMYRGPNGPAMAKGFYDFNREKMLEGVILLWPERWDYYTLRVKYEEDPISFKSEYQNEPVDPNTRMFNIDELKYWSDHYSSKDALLREMGEEADFFGACDPSMGDDLTKGDYSAIVVLGWDKKARAMFVVEADIRRRKPDQLLTDIMVMHGKYRFKKFAMEANSGQEFLIQQLEQKCSDVRQFIPIERIKNTQNKIQRIQSIQPFTKNMVQFSKEHRLLLEQLRDFPTAKYDDGPDALEMVLKVSQNFSAKTVDMEKMTEVLKKVSEISTVKNKTIMVRDPITGRSRVIDNKHGLLDI
jgi:predicted phage terminase large subunit-like protein